MLVVTDDIIAPAGGEGECAACDMGLVVSAQQRVHHVDQEVEDSTVVADHPLRQRTAGL
jgi:hypothetical protein